MLGRQARNQARAWRQKLQGLEGVFWTPFLPTAQRVEGLGFRGGEGFLSISVPCYTGSPKDNAINAMIETFLA